MKTIEQKEELAIIMLKKGNHTFVAFFQELCSFHLNRHGRNKVSLLLSMCRTMDNGKQKSRSQEFACITQTNKQIVTVCKQTNPTTQHTNRSFW